MKRSMLSAAVAALMFAGASHAQEGPTVTGGSGGSGVEEALARAAAGAIFRRMTRGDQNEAPEAQGAYFEATLTGRSSGIASYNMKINPRYHDVIEAMEAPSDDAASDDSSGRPTEPVSINFVRITVQERPRESDSGARTAPPSGGFDEIFEQAIASGQELIVTVADLGPAAPLEMRGPEDRPARRAPECPPLAIGSGAAPAPGEFARGELLPTSDQTVFDVVFTNFATGQLEIAQMRMPPEVGEVINRTMAAGNRTEVNLRKNWRATIAETIR